MARQSRLPGPLVAACLTLATAAPAHAQAVVTLDEALATARARNASVRAARLGTDAAAAGISEARAGFFPRVSIAERWQRGNEPVFVFGSRLSARQFTAAGFAIDALNHPDPTGAFHTSVTLDQTLFDGGRTAAEQQAASLRRDIARHEAEAVAEDVAVAVTRAYSRALVARAAGTAAAQALESAREDVATAERRRDVGTVTEADVLSLRVQAVDFEQRRIEADGEYTSALAELRYLTGLPAAGFDVIEPPPPDTPGGDDPERLAEAAAATRPELLRAGAAVQLGDAVRRQTRSPLVPEVAVQSVMDFAGTRFADRASSWIVGGEVRWTLSTGGAELARRRAAAAAQARAAAEHDDARARVRAEVTAAVQRLQAARARQRVGAAAVAQARESERIVRDRFEAGLAMPADVLRVAAAAFEAEQRRVAGVADLLVREAELDRVTGRSLEGAGR